MSIVEYFDMLTISRVYIFSQFAVTIAYIAIFKIFSKPYMNYMIFGSLIEGIGFVVLAYSTILPFYIMLAMGNFAIQFGFFLLLFGMVGIVGEKIEVKVMITIFTIYYFLWLIFTYIHYSIGGRVIVFAGTQIVASVYLMSIFIRYIIKTLKREFVQKKPLFIMSFMVVIMTIVYCVLNLWRIYYSLNQDRLLPLVDKVASDKWILLYMTAVVIIRAVIIFVYHIYELLHAPLDVN